MALEEPKKIAGGAYGRYMAENRPALMKECAGKPITAITKLGSERYKALSESEKAKYENMYQDAKTQYEKDMAAFLAAGGEKKVRGRKKDQDGKKRKKKDPNAPKTPVGGAYGCFLEEMRPQLTKECTGQPVTAVTKLAVERWKAMSAAEKQPYEKAYEVKKAAYEQAKKDYKPPEGQSVEDTGKTPRKKRGRTSGSSVATPSHKSTRTSKKATTHTSTSSFDTAVLAEAEKLGMKASLENLAARPEIASRGLKEAELLEALRQAGGLVNKAKSSILSA